MIYSILVSAGGGIPPPELLTKLADVAEICGAEPEVLFAEGLVFEVEDATFDFRNEAGRNLAAAEMAKLGAEVMLVQMD